MASLDKMLRILDLFDEDRIGVQLEDAMRVTQSSRATAYRYLQALSEAGILAPSAGGVYVLGPRIIELDRLMRLTDPLLTGARPVLEKIGREHKMNAMLCSYYGNKVMCADLVWPDTTIKQVYQRGRPMPMFSGAMAKAILSNLTPYQLRNIMLWHADEIRSAGLGQNWDEFRSTMSRMRKDRCVVTQGEVIPRLVGAASPVFDPDGRVLGSLVLIVSDKRFARMDAAVWRDQAIAAAKEVGENIARNARRVGKPPMPPRPRRSRIRADILT